MAFPATPAVVTIRAAFGADVSADPSTWTWTDITSYWETSEPVSVSDGRSEGATQAEASEATLTLDATDGALMPEDPRSPYWPWVDVGTPVWMVLDAGAGALDLVQGFISALTPTWPGKSRALCWVRVTVRGILDQLGRGESPLKAPLLRAVLGDAPVAYWPLDDGRDATSMASALPSSAPMSMMGSPGLAAVDGPAGAATDYVKIVSGGARAGEISSSISMQDLEYWEIEVWIYVSGMSPSSIDPSYDGDQRTILSWTTTGTYKNWRLVATYAGTGALSPGPNINLWYQTSADAGTAYGMQSVPLTLGVWHHIRIRSQTISGTQYSYRWFDGVQNGSSFSGTSAGVITYVTSQVMTSYGGVSGEVYERGIQIAALAHLAVYNTATSDHYPAGLGFAGEAASDRVVRLCAEEGVRVAVTSSSSEPMGPQASSTFLSLLRECEATDGGRLSEYDFGLRYRPRSSLYNQAVALSLSGTAKEVSDPFAPTKDLQRRRNEWKISRPNGSSAVYADKADQKTRGRLDDSATINVATDGALLHHAEWRTGIGTTPGMRYPSLSVDLGRHPGLIAAWQALQLGDRVQAVNLVQQHPRDAIDQLVEGRRQTLRGRTAWAVTLITSPARPYTVMVIGDIALGRLDTSTSALAVGATATAVTLLVETISGPLLTTTAAYPGDFPFDADLDGERVTVTAITGATSPQTVTVVRAVNGVIKSHLAGRPLRLWQPGQSAL